MKLCSSVPLHAHVRHVLWRVYFRYGQAVARYPWPFLVLPVLVLGELGAGLILKDTFSVWDDVNLPRDSQAFKDQARVQSLFPDHTGDHYDALELNEDQIMGSIIFTATAQRHNASIYDDDVIEEIRQVIADIKTHVTIQEDGVTLKYEDLCGRRHNACVVTGERLLAPQFNKMRKMGILSYPKWKLPTTGDTVDLSFALADSDSQLQRVGVVRVTFKLRHDRQPKVFLWEEAFVDFMKTLKTNTTEFVFSASSSVSRELEESFYADVLYVWLCLVLLAVCCVTVTWGGDVISTRVLLVPMGVVSPVLGVVAAMGLLSYCKVKVVEMTWLVPLLVLGKGLSDMFLLMTAWSSRLGREGEGVEERVGWCVAEVGGTITLTSLTMTLAFCLGYTCTTPSLANFALYAGVAVLFCYISTMMFGVGCLATHGHRVMSSHHTLTCCVTLSRDQLRKEGRSPCWSIICGGSPVRENYRDQSMAEKLSRLVLLKCTGSLVGKVVISVLFLALLAASVFGIVNMKQGVELQTLVPQSSYIHDYLQTDSKYFGFSFPVVFVMNQDMHCNQETADLMIKVLERAQHDPDIQDDFVRCWIVDFMKSPSYNLTTKGKDFPGSVVKEFLNTSEIFMGDVVLDEAEDRVVASRCYVFTKKNSYQEEMTQLMERTRTLAAEAGFPIFAYHPAFLLYDQRLAILPTLFKMMGTALITLCALHLLFFPEVVSILLTVSSTGSILLGTVGLMNFLGISVSYISIPHLILNMGFALQFSVQMSTAYLQSEFVHRSERVADAVSRAAVPVFLSALCLLGSVFILLAASSYSFGVLFKVTVLTLLMIIFNCLFFTPVVLSLVGHEKSTEENDKDLVTKQDIIRRVQKKATTTSDDTVIEKWNDDIPPSDTKIHAIGNGIIGQRYVNNKTLRNNIPKEDYAIGNGSIGQRYVNNKTLMNNIPKEDYENASVVMCPHGLTSTSFEHAGKRLSSSGYYNTPAGQYENWSRRNGGGGGSGSRDVYDLPVSVPSSKSERHGVRDPVLRDTEFTDRHSRPLPGRNASVSSPISSPRSPRQGKAAHSPRTLRNNSPSVDFSIEDADDVFLESPSGQSVTSLEGVHHVACTLSTSGALAATQNYVTENFRDIPA
ncbi:hypothetical protein ACOMHN_051356 [Nucella lapillus]